MSKFKKGDHVTLITSWDHKGQVAVRHAVVTACGVRQMTLVDAKNGECLGRHFDPAGQGYRLKIIHNLIHSDELAAELAKDWGESYLAQEIIDKQTQIERMNARAARPEQLALWERDLAELEAAKVEIVERTGKP